MSTRTVIRSRIVACVFEKKALPWGDEAHGDEKEDEEDDEEEEDAKSGTREIMTNPTRSRTRDAGSGSQRSPSRSPLCRSLASGSSNFAGVGVRWSGFLGFACSSAFYPLPSLWHTELRLSYVSLKTVC